MSGRYRLEGDFTNGNLTLAFGENETISIEIRDGQFTIRDTENGQTIVFNKQDNAAVPKASDPTQNGDWGGGDNPQGGDVNHYPDSIYAQLAYYPAKFAEKEVAAWYMLVDQYPEVNPVELRVEAIFLFKDNTFAVTEFKAHYGADASKPDYNLHAEGTFSVTKGDYANGWAYISPYNGNPFDVKIENGQLFAQNSTYYLQSTKPMVTELDDDPQGGDDNPQGGDTIISTLEPFFPTQYTGKPVSAWFTSTGTYSESGYKMDLLTAVYFFDDNSFVTAVSMIISETAGVSYERIIGGAGQYRLDGNFTAGKLAMTGPDGQAITVEINNGQFKVEENGTITVYTRQDNASIPEPSNPTEYNDDPQGGDDDPQGGDISHIADSIYAQLAYYPTKYVDKQVNAWYVLASTEDQKIRIEAVYLFADNTLAVTKSKYYTDGRQPEFKVVAEGQYRLSQGDYTNGTAAVISDDGSFDATIENGKLSVPMGENGTIIVFSKMSNSQLPEAYNPNDNPQGGDDDPQGGNDNQGGIGEIGSSSIYGTWVNDLTNPEVSLTLNENGTGIMWDEQFKFTYQDGVLNLNGQSKFQITIEGDVMIWSYVDEEGGVTPTGEVWFRANGAFDNKVSDGRWDGYMGELSDHGIVYLFSGDNVDIYIIAWGEHLKGTFTHEGGIINFNLREGYNARIGNETSWSWEAGNLNPKTLQLTEGYAWWQMDIETLNERKQEVASFTFALVSDVKAYGGLFGRTMTIQKTK